MGPQRVKQDLATGQQQQHTTNICWIDEKCSQLYELNILAKYVRDLSDIISHQEDILVDSSTYLGSHFHINYRKSQVG